MSDNKHRYLTALPLLLAASLLLIGAAWAFYQGNDGTGSIAAFSAGLILLGAWMTTAIVDWHEGHPQKPTFLKEDGDDERPE